MRMTLLAVLLLAVLTVSTSASPPEKCGAWRWGIKTLSDLKASAVDFTPENSTVQELRDLTPPALGRRTPRIWPVEFTTYRLRANLLAHKWVCCRDKDDGDYHLVLSDPSDNKLTMIAEITDPDCPGSRESHRVGAFRAVRSTYRTLLGTPPRGRFRTFSRPREIILTGVGFFDAVHGQRGVAPNGIELHPVLGVEVVR